MIYSRLLQWLRCWTKTNFSQSAVRGQISKPKYTTSDQHVELLQPIAKGSQKALNFAPLQPAINITLRYSFPQVGPATSTLFLRPKSSKMNHKSDLQKYSCGFLFPTKNQSSKTQASRLQKHLGLAAPSSLSSHFRPLLKSSLVYSDCLWIYLLQ